MSPPAAAPVDAIYLSPHFDDAVLSCGGQIHARARRGERVLVVTVFTGAAPPQARLSAFAVELHEQWALDPATAVEARRSENRDALGLLGVAGIDLDLPDALYRVDASGEALYPRLDALYGEQRSEDEAVTTRLRDAFASLPESPLVAAPLGVGAHVDHRLVLRAARAAVPESRLWLYEEFPYGERLRARRRAIRGRGGWSTRTEVLSEADVAARCGAILCYRSQLGTVFADDADVERRVRRFVRRRGGERLWHPTDRPAVAAEP